MSCVQKVYSVVLVDGNQHFLRIATRMLQEAYGTRLSVLGVSTSDDEIMLFARDQQPHVIIVDLDQNCPQRLQLMAHLRSEFPWLGIVGIGSLDTEAYQTAALAAGADAFIEKTAIHQEVLTVLQTVITQRMQIQQAQRR